MASKPKIEKIGKRVVDALKPGERVWDTEIKGFCVRCQKVSKTYLLKYRFSHHQRWYTIGKHGSPWTPDTARTEAKRLLGIVADSIDPSSIRDGLKNKPTMADLCKRFMHDYSSEHKKPSSQASDQRNIDNHVLPLLGRLYVADVTRSDVDSFKRDVKDGKTAKDEKRGKRSRSIVRGGPGVANKSLALLSKMFNLAERWELRPEGSNPCRHVDKYKTNAMERFLSAKELSALATALNKAESELGYSPYFIAAIRLLILTGARAGEIIALEWSHVDFERQMLLLPDNKTGAKVIYLNAPALNVLSEIPRLKKNPFVIVGDKKGAALVNLQKPWRRVRKMAGLDDVRIHDLRHSFASAAAAGGMSLPVIGKLLGHTQVQTTARYSHLADDPLKAANEAIGQKIVAMMGGDTEANNLLKFPKSS